MDYFASVSRILICSVRSSLQFSFPSVYPFGGDVQRHLRTQDISRDENACDSGTVQSPFNGENYESNLDGF